jgi:hypothetical protein
MSNYFGKQPSSRPIRYQNLSYAGSASVTEYQLRQRDLADPRGQRCCRLFGDRRWQCRLEHRSIRCGIQAQHHSGTSRAGLLRARIEGKQLGRPPDTGRSRKTNPCGSKGTCPY